MPGKVKVKVVSGRNLPVMDKGSDTTDAFVEIKLGSVTHKTDVCRKSLNPHWSSNEWYRFELDDADLQDEPLQLRLMDHDTYSANDAIGKVYISLNPLLLRTADAHKEATVSGWIPVFDTMHGIRGEVNVVVKVELFSDFNKFRQSSCGVRFFHSPSVPQGYRVQAVRGFVEELVVEDDPEYQWIDKIRTPRASNEARQVAFLKLSGQVQRRIGLKALELGANAVVGFKRCLDLEGEVGVVARGAGTAVTLVKILDHHAPAAAAPAEENVQQQLKKYLEFINLSHADTGQKPTDDQQMATILNILSPPGPRPYPDRSETGSEFNEGVPDESYVKNLLEQEDNRSESSRTSLQKGIKTLQSKAKRLSGIGRKSYDDENSDRLSLASCTSEKSVKFSFSDIKTEIKKKAKFRRPMFMKRPGSGMDASSDMAAALVRSVIHAHSSLDCIKEIHESNSPMSTLRRPSRPQPIVCASDPPIVIENASPQKENQDENPLKLQFIPVDNVSLNSATSAEGKTTLNVHRRVSESCPTTPLDSSVNNSLLMLPNEKAYLGSSVSSMAPSSDEYSSSDSEDLSFNTKTDETSNLDTVSLVVRSILEHQVDNDIIKHMEEKLESISPKFNTGFLESIKNDGPNDGVDKKSIEFESEIKAESIRNNLSPELKVLPIELPSIIGETEMESTNTTNMALQTMLLDKLNIIGAHGSSSEPKTPQSCPVGHEHGKNKFKFHFPKFKRHLSEGGAATVKETENPHKQSRHSFLSLSPLKKRLRTFSHGEKDQPTLVKTAIQTMLMEKVNIMGEIIQHAPLVGDEKHLVHGPESRPKDFTSIPYDRRCSEDLLSLNVKETVLGSNFMSYDELRFASDPNLHVLRTPTLSETFSLMSLKSVDNHFPRNIKEREEFSNKQSKVGSTKDFQPLRNDQFKKSSLDDVKSVDFIHSVYESKEALEKEMHFDKSILASHVLFEETHETKTEDAKDSLEDIPEDKTDEKLEVEIHHREEEEEDKPIEVVHYRHHTSKAKSELSLDSANLKHRTAAPRGGSLTTGVCGPSVLRPAMNQENMDLLEYPFLTIVKFPPGFVLSIGGAVAARSVKLLERVPNPEEPAPRDAWWGELRTEVRSHMRAFRCNAVLAYQETTTICDDICVLSATGTAAVIDLRSSALPYGTMYTDPNLVTLKIHDQDNTNRGELTQTSSLDRNDFDKADAANANVNPKTGSDAPPRVKRPSERCGPCHLPYSVGSVPFKINANKCALCRKGRVPSVMLCSIEPVDGLSIVGRGCLVQAVASRTRVPAKGEPAARDISDQLPFLEYELHRLLLAKLRVRGMNAIFGLKTTIAVGATIVAAVGVGTGVLLAALGPCTAGPKLRAAPGDPKLVKALQRGLDDALHANRNVYHLHMDAESTGKAQTSDTEESDEDLPDLEVNAGNKDTCVLEVDDAEDLEVLKMLTESHPPAGLHVVNTQSVPGLPSCDTLGSVAHLQMFTQLWRARLSSPTTSLHPHFHRLLQSVYFKLRRMVPCAVCDLKFRLDLPEADEIQIVVTGMALGINESIIENRLDGKNGKNSEELKRSESNEMIFTLDEENATDINPSLKSNKQTVRKTDSPALFAPEWRPAVVMTPLALVPGARILEYLGNLDFIFVRESTSVREQGGLSGFLHTFITEVLAVVRAHVAALAGNAIVAFYMTELILSDNPHKNQAQCLVSVGGDVVLVSYLKND